MKPLSHLCSLGCIDVAQGTDNEVCGCKIGEGNEISDRLVVTLYRNVGAIEATIDHCTVLVEGWYVYVYSWCSSNILLKLLNN